MSTEEILKAGIAAAEAGDLARATALFAEVVKIDPSSEQGWLGLGFCVSAPDQREYCFRRVLALNPNNRNAKEQLAFLSKPNTIPPPIRAQQSTSAEVLSSPNSREPVRPQPAPIATPKEKVSPAKQELAPSRVAQTSSKIIRQNQANRQKKKTNATLISIIVAVPILIICGLGIGLGFFYISTHPALVGTQPPLLTQSNTQPPSTSTPIATSSPTLNPPTPIPSPIPTVVYTPTFESATCSFTAPVANVNCGYLIVPEDRTGDPSHTIKLAVAVYHSQSPDPAEPVLFLQGGPGAEAVKLSADDYKVLVAPFLSKRDFIVFDQRGTGLSVPTLNCDDLTNLYSQDIHGLIPASTRELGLLQRNPVLQRIAASAGNKSEGLYDCRKCGRCTGSSHRAEISKS